MTFKFESYNLKVKQVIYYAELDRQIVFKCCELQFQCLFFHFLRKLEWSKMENLDYFLWFKKIVKFFSAILEPFSMQTNSGELLRSKLYKLQLAFKFLLINCIFKVFCYACSQRQPCCLIRQLLCSGLGCRRLRFDFWINCTLQ